MGYKNPEVVIIAGKKGSGKSTIAHHIGVRHQYAPVKLAQPLKDMLRVFMEYQGIPKKHSDDYIEGALKETPTNAFMKKTARHAMQTLGTQWGRQHIHEDVWAEIAARRVHDIITTGGQVVIDDVRFPNEIEIIKEALRYNDNIEIVTIWVERPGLKEADLHVSENSLSRSNCDFTIFNDGDEEHLLLDVDRFIEKADTSLFAA